VKEHFDIVRVPYIFGDWPFFLNFLRTFLIIFVSSFILPDFINNHFCSLNLSVTLSSDK